MNQKLEIAVILVVCGILIGGGIGYLFGTGGEEEKAPDWEQYRKFVMWKYNQSEDLAAYMENNVTIQWTNESDPSPVFHPRAQGEPDMHYITINNTGNKSFHVHMTLHSPMLEQYNLRCIYMDNGNWSEAESFKNDDDVVYMYNNSTVSIGLVIDVKDTTPHDMYVENNSLSVSLVQKPWIDKYKGIGIHRAVEIYSGMADGEIKLPFKVVT